MVVTFDRHPREVLTGEKPAALASLEHRLILLARAGVDAALVLPFDETHGEHVGRGVRAHRPRADAPRAKGPARGEPPLRPRPPGRPRVPEPSRPRAGIRRARAGPRARRRRGATSSPRPRSATRSARAVSATRSACSDAPSACSASRARRRARPAPRLSHREPRPPPRGAPTSRRLCRRVAVGDGVEPRPRLAARLAVVNVGRRPTFHPEADEDSRRGAPARLEGDLYDRTLEVSFLAKLRDERRFRRSQGLVAQIEADVATARARFAGLFERPAPSGAESDG